MIVKLPNSNGYNSILVVVDRFSKMKHFIPCRESMSAPDLANLFVTEEQHLTLDSYKACISNWVSILITILPTTLKQTGSGNVSTSGLNNTCKPM